jgi:hypothetical protein
MIDIHIAINPGETPLKAILREYQKRHPQVYVYEIDPVSMTYGGQNYPGIVKYVNDLTLAYSRGRYIMPMNDDALFTTQNWDIMCLNKLNAFQERRPDGLVLGLTGDDIRAQGFMASDTPTASFPIISRVGVEHFGFLFAPTFYHNTADTHICWLYHDKKRTIELREELFIKHRPPELCKFIPTNYRTEIEVCDMENPMERVPQSELMVFLNTQTIPEIPNFLTRYARDELLKISLREASKVEGLYCEFGSGVYVTPVIKSFLPNKLLYTFDSFEGFKYEPYTDLHTIGTWGGQWFNETKYGGEEVEAALRKLPDVTVVKGWFQDTVAPFFEEYPQKIVFAHFDCGLSSATQCVFDAIMKYNKLQVGTVLQFNGIFYSEISNHKEYWYNGVFKVWDNIIRKYNLGIEYIGWTGSYHCAYRITKI